MQRNQKENQKQLLYDPSDIKFFKKGYCFLCGNKITKKGYSQEHIFPKWLLNKYKLWTNRLTLLNKKTLQYKQIKIPCCSICNGKLGNLEKKIASAANDGYKKFIKIPKIFIFQWLLKIIYLILYKETDILLDPSNPLKGSIVHKKILENFRTSHLFLQSVRIKSKFHKPPPWSIFIFQIQKNKERKLNFDYKDNIPLLSVAIRMDDIGIIACLQDNNISEKFFQKEFKKLQKKLLHPIQFDELIAKIFYQRSLLNRTPKYISISNGPQLEIISLPLQGFSTNPIYDKWNVKDYARFLSLFLKLPYENCYKSPNKFFTILYNEKGRFKNLIIGKEKKP